MIGRLLDDLQEPVCRWKEGICMTSITRTRWTSPAAQVAYHMMLAHSLAVKRYRTLGQDARRIGII